jgi:hypothetical protein
MNDAQGGRKHMVHLLISVYRDLSNNSLVWCILNNGQLVECKKRYLSVRDTKFEYDLVLQTFNEVLKNSKSFHLARTDVACYFETACKDFFRDLQSGYFLLKELGVSPYKYLYLARCRPSERLDTFYCRYSADPEASRAIDKMKAQLAISK